MNRTGLAIRIFDSDGVGGCYVYPSPEPAMAAQAKSLAKLLIGRNPNAREKMYDDIKRIMRKLGAFGYSPLDIALWDMAGPATRQLVRRDVSGSNQSGTKCMSGVGTVRAPGRMIAPSAASAQRSLPRPPTWNA